MHIGPWKVFPSTDCIVAESFDRSELCYRTTWIIIGVDEINKIYMRACDNLFSE